MSRQLRQQKIKYSRFLAIDGRCKDSECKTKKKELENKYSVKIAKKLVIPAASLTLGTMQILKEMVRKKWDYILICEDDINLEPNLNKKFKKGIEEIREKGLKWDVLYLGSGGQTGFKGISEKRSKNIKHKTSWAISDDSLDFYVQNKDDLRMPCEGNMCEKMTEDITRSWSVGGAWCYAYSLQGAKKLLKIMGNKIKDHIDTILMDAQYKDKMMALCFDPPIVYHEGGAVRSDTTIPW